MAARGLTYRDSGVDIDAAGWEQKLLNEAGRAAGDAARGAVVLVSARGGAAAAEAVDGFAARWHEWTVAADPPRGAPPPLLWRLARTPR